MTDTGDTLPPTGPGPAPIPAPMPAPAATGLPGGSPQPVWYKRTWVIVVAAVVLVVVASVLIDLPRPISNAEDVSSQTASLQEINQDIAPCGYAINETFLIHHDQVTGVLTPSDRAAAPKMLTDDQTACSFTNESVYDLTNNIQVQDTTAGKYVDRMLTVVTTWVTSDALAAVEDIQTLYLHPGNPTATRDLAHQEQLLTNDRSQAIFDIQKADVLLHAHLPAPQLPNLPTSSSLAGG